MRPYSAALNSSYSQQNHTILHRQIEENTVYDVHNHSRLLLLHPAIDFHPHHIATVTPCLTKRWMTATKLRWSVVFSPSMSLWWCAPSWRLWPGHEIFNIFFLFLTQKTVKKKEKQKKNRSIKIKQYFLSLLSWHCLILLYMSPCSELAIPSLLTFRNQDCFVAFSRVLLSEWSRVIN